MNFVDSAIDASPDAVVLCDDKGRVCGWNTIAETLFGYSRSEAMGRCVSDLVLSPEVHARYRQLLTGLVNGDSNMPADGQQRIMVVTRSRDHVPVELWYRAVREQGEFRLIGYFRDQRHLDLLESRLAQTNLESRLLDQPELFSCDAESLEAALQMSLDALCDVTGWPLGHALLPDMEGQALVATPVWSAHDPAAFSELMNGCSRRRFAAGENLPGQVWQTGLAAWKPWEANVHAAGESRELLAAGVGSSYCVPIKIRRRVIAVLEFFCRNAEPPEESLVRLVRRLSRSLGHVIERREWEVERQRMAAVVETSFDAIISKAPDGTIISWNSGAERLYEYSAEEAIGQHISMILPETMAHEESELLEAAAQGRRMEQFDTVRRRKSGELIAISLTTSPLRNSSGRIIGSSTIERDVTRRREAQQRLEYAIQTAEEASRAKSEFLANISHELRTPMNVILGMTELSLHEELPEIVRDYLVTVKDSADTMLFLINDILDFSRLEAERFELDPLPFDIRRMLDETMRALSLRAHEKGLELAARVDPDVPFRLLGDPMRLRQMLTNLIGNAIKFTQTGEVVVSLEIGDSSAAADNSAWNAGDAIQLHFCVLDTGIGISEADQRRIFAPFTQADASITRLYDGTGLGLAICHELATLQNGRIWVDSQEGRGSRFHFTVSMEVAPASEEPESPAQIQRSKLKGTRVLVVDDNKTNRHIIREMLESWSMRPSVADSAESAIRELHAAAEVGEGFPLLIVDAVMPHTDGIELLEKIEATTESVGATILMISPADQHLFRQRSEGLPVNAFLEKPVSQSSLLNSIREAVGDVAIVRSLDHLIQPAPQSLSVLIAEDIPANQKVVSAILRRRGHEVTIAHNGREAIDLYERGRFDVALMDVQMPILDGLQATKAIRRLESGTDRHIPIVAMTAHAMRGDRQACLDVGMDGYVSKPLDAELLLRTVEQLSPPRMTDSELHESLFTKSGVWRVRRPARSEEMHVVPVESNPANAHETSERPSDADPAQTESVWKPQVAMRRMGGDADLLKSMIGYFLEDAPDLLHQLETLIQSGNAGESTRVAHSLKGLCSSFEATEPTRVAMDVEIACRNQNFQEAAQLKPALERQVSRLTRSLTQWQASHRQ